MDNVGHPRIMWRDVMTFACLDEHTEGNCADKIAPWQR